MRNRRERALAELYDATERLSQPEITPILQGTCHIQGPVDEYDYELQRSDSGHFPVETKCLNTLKDPHTRAEPGTCNVCSAPCSLCLHFNRPSPLMESKLEGGPSDNVSRKEDDSCSCIAASDHVVKRRARDKQKHAYSETSHSLSSSSSHDSSVENAESKETFRASVAHDASDNVVISPKVNLDAVEDNHFLQEQISSTAGSPFSSHGCKTSDLHHRKASDITEEKHREECHPENSSHISGSKDANNAIHGRLVELDNKVVGCSSRSVDSLLVKNDEEAIQKEAAHDCSNSEVGENQTESKGNGKSSTKNSTTSSFRDGVLCHKTDGIEDPRSSSNIYPKEQFPCSGSPRNRSLSQCSMDDEKSPIKGKLVADILNGQKDTADGEVNNEDSGKCQPQLVSSKGIDECLGTENGNDSRFQPYEAIKCSVTNEQSDKLTSNSQLSQVSLQPNSDHEVAAEIEDDVKVCDICGDAGQEELLAICSRCSDGAEHTYCMRIMLEKVPEGEWLCEECQLKEAENQMIGKSEAQKAPCLDENSQNIESTLKILPCVDIKAIDPDVRRDDKEISNSGSSKRKGENSEVTSVTKEKFSEACDVSNGTTIPRKPTLLSCENSSNSHENSSNKSDSVKVKPPTLITSCGQLECISQPRSHSQTSSDPDSSKPQAHFEPTRGPLSKSVSFNNSKVPKVKQLLETIPQKQKMTRESNSSSTRKEGPLRTITKSASFRSEGSSFTNVETISKVQSLNPPQPEDPRGVKRAKERTIIDKKISTSDCRFVSPSVSATCVSSVKVDSKVQQYDAKVKRMSDSSNLGNNRGSNEATSLANEVKKQPSLSLSRTSGSTSLIRLCKNEDQKSTQLVPKAAELMHRDDKTKDHTLLSNSRQAASAGNRLSRCQRCNETGHATQFCAVDKLRMSAMKPSSERSSRDVDNRSIKWKDTGEGSSWKPGMKRTAKSPDQSEEVSLSSADVNSEATSKDFPSSSVSSRNLLSVEGAADVQDFSKATNAIHVKQKLEDHKKAICLPRKGTVLDFADDLNMRPVIQTLPDQASVPAHPLRVSVIPELNYIWQGAFEVLRTAKPPAIFDGFQAHLSTYVSPKALEVATQFPCKVQLEEVPRLSSWPTQFHKNNPKEDNIALFFFAKDVESYEKYYWKLLENMLKNDLALVGNIDAVELLIFPSNVLPENSQRWNKLFYLWGVFRGRNKNNLGDLPGLEKKPSVSNLNLEPTIQDLPTPVISGLCLPLDISDESSLETSRPNRSPKAMASTDLQDIAVAGNEDGILNAEQPPLFRKTLHQAVADDKVLTEQTSCSLLASCSFRNMSQLPGVPVAYPEPKLQIDIEQLPSDMENDLTSLDKLTSDSDSRKDSDASSTRISNHEDCMHSVLLNCWQGNDRKVQKIKQKENFISEPVSDNQLSENVVEAEHLSWELKPNRKRAQPSSVEAIKNSSGHMLKSTADIMLWKGEAVCTFQNDEKEHKKMRLDSGGHAICRSREQTRSDRLSSKLQPLPPGFMYYDSIYCETVSEGSKNSERCFFPIDLGPTTSTKEDNLIYVLSSDDEDSPESTTPDLELALGGKNRPIKQDISPLLSPKFGEKSNQDKLPASAVDDGDDTPASLSLSLAFPASEKAQTAKPISQSDQLLSDKPCINTSLFLFGGYTDP